MSFLYVDRRGPAGKWLHKPNLPTRHAIMGSRGARRSRRGSTKTINRLAQETTTCQGEQSLPAATSPHTIQKASRLLLSGYHHNQHLLLVAE